LIKDFINTLYPNFCAGCDNILSISEKGICSSCWIEIKKFDNRNNTFFFGRRRVEMEFYAFEFVKNQLFQKIIHQIKYKGNKVAARVLGIELGKVVQSKSIEIDIIIPVPISNKKRSYRGFNQCDYIAGGVQQIIKKPVVSDFLLRADIMNSQINSNRYRRWEKVENQFIINRDSLGFVHVLLVDDIVTSGATIHGCIKKLTNENLLVSVAALAKTQ
jgi:ComF family protein